MSFGFPYLFKSGIRKKREFGSQHPQMPHHPPPPSQLPPGIQQQQQLQQQQQQHSHSNKTSSSSSSSDRDHYPTLVSMIQAKTAASSSPNPSPSSSSTSSRSRPTSLAVPLEPEELEYNRCYRYIRSHFNLIFTRSAVVCIPHSRSVDGMILTKDFVETHSYNPSPYYRGQYQAANGKVVAIEHPIISTVSDFKEPRTLHILAEEWVYIGRKKIRVLMIDRPLEGDLLVPPHQQRQHNPNTITIPATRSSKQDLDFLNLFPENAEPLYELQSSVQKFVDSYVYIRGFNAYTVEKIQHMYIKAYESILQRNKLLRDTCHIQSEHDHFLELVENVVLGFLHEKIWIHSLKTILHAQDSYIDSICRVYAKETITLSRYTVSHPMTDMPLHCFEPAIMCLRRVDPDAEAPISILAEYDRANKTANPPDRAAFTPLEKLACVRETLEHISSAVTQFIRGALVGQVDDDSPLTTDEMIPLFAYVLVHSRVSRIASLSFYMENFRLSFIERSEYSYALVTLKAAIKFLKDDPLSLQDASSGLSTLSNHSASSAAFSPKLQQSFRVRSTSFGSPIPHPPSGSHYRSVSMSSQSEGKPATAPAATTSPAAAATPSPRLRHRKSHSADLQGITDECDSTCSSAASSRRNSLTPSVIIRPPIVLPSPRETNRHSLDITNDWMLHHPHHSQTPPPFSPTSHERPLSRPSSIGHTRPLVSTTFPTISNSSPLPSHTNPVAPPSEPQEVKPQDTNPTAAERKLSRSLSSTSSLFERKTQPPQVINIEGPRRPASICIDPRLMRRDEGNSNLMGDFLQGLQSLDGDIVGERSGSYRTYRRL